MSRKITSVSISEPLDAFIQSLIATGRYGNASEVIRSALRLLEQQEHNDEMTRRAVLAGLESGVSALTPDDVAERCKAKYRDHHEQINNSKI